MAIDDERVPRGDCMERYKIVEICGLTGRQIQQSTNSAQSMPQASRLYLHLHCDSGQ